jgi:hypothetical protein
MILGFAAERDIKSPEDGPIEFFAGSYIFDHDVDMIYEPSSINIHEVIPPFSVTL